MPEVISLISSSRHLVVALNKVVWDYRCRIIFDVLKSRFFTRVRPFFKDMIISSPLHCVCFSPCDVFIFLYEKSLFDAASWASQGTSFTAANVCSGFHWFA